MTSHDLVIELLAASEAELKVRVASLEADVESYRLLVQQTLTALHDLTVQRDLLRLRLRLAHLHARTRRVSESDAATESDTDTEQPATTEAA